MLLITRSHLYKMICVDEKSVHDDLTNLLFQSFSLNVIFNFFPSSLPPSLGWCVDLSN